MNRNILLFILSIICTYTFAQKVQNISEVPPIKKGILITNAGEKILFLDLQLDQDTVIIRLKDTNLAKIPCKDVFKISKNENSSGFGAIAGGVAGLLVGVLDIPDLNNGDNKGTFLIYTTLGGALFGGIMGAFIERDKQVYNRSSSYVLYPYIYLDNSRLYTIVGVKFKLK
jgi:hypothetical protein